MNSCKNCYRPNQELRVHYYAHQYDLDRSERYFFQVMEPRILTFINEKVGHESRFYRDMKAHLPGITQYQVEFIGRTIECGLKYHCGVVVLSCADCSYSLSMQNHNLAELLRNTTALCVAIFCQNTNRLTKNDTISRIIRELRNGRIHVIGDLALPQGVLISLMRYIDWV